MAGLKDDNTPFISGMDLIGAPVFAKDFVVAGTCASNLYGLCESFFQPNLVSKIKERRRGSGGERGRDYLCLLLCLGLGFVYILLPRIRERSGSRGRRRYSRGLT